MGKALSDRVRLRDGFEMLVKNILRKKMQSALIVQSQRERCRRELRQQ